jgi:hypothetical protein
VRIAVIQSTQDDSCGNVVPNEKAAMGDFCARLVPKLNAMGHTAMQFSSNESLGVQAAYAAAAWHPQIALMMHLDSAGGTPAAMLCYQEARSLSMGLGLLGVYCTCLGVKNKGGQLRVVGVNGGRIAVVRICESNGIPSALFELGDMDAPDGYHWLDPAYRERAAVCFAQAVSKVFGGGTPIVKAQEDDDMYPAKPNAPAYVPAWIGASQKCYLDFTPQGNGAVVRLSFTRDNGDKCSMDMVRKIAITSETSARIEVGAYWKEIGSGGVTVKVEVLDGVPIIVTRKQTI